MSLAKMKILLLNPPHEESIIREGRCQQLSGPFNTTYPPLALATLSSILENENNVAVIDCIAQNISENNLYKRIKSDKYDLIISSTSTPSFESDIRILKKLKTIAKAKTYTFGVHAKYEKKAKIDGIELIKTTPEEFAFKLIRKEYSFDKTPIPNWNKIDLNNYRFPLTNQKYILMQPTRGCKNNCTFCVAPFYYGNRVKRKSIESIKKELSLIEKIDIKFIIVLSEDIASHEAYFNNFCKEMKKSNIEWECSIKVSDLNKNKIKTLSKSGCKILSMGIESDNSESLKKSKKHIDLKHAKEMIQYCNKYGILTIGHFILGFKEETKKESKKTINLAKHIGVDYALFYNLIPFPGSLIYEEEKSNITNIPLSKFEYSNPFFSDKNMIHIAYKSFYLNSILKRIIKTVRVLGIKSIPALISHSIWFMKTLLKRN